MNRAVRMGLIATAGTLLALVLIISVSLLAIIRRPFPKTNGTISVNGLQAEVVIYRDEFGVPHIYAENQDDLFFAQGYVHAQDRFWQMEFRRHIGLGRLSEIVGQAGLDNDKFIRTIGWNRIAADTLAKITNEEPEMLAILEAYSAGVNAYIEQNRNRLALDHTILNLVNERREIEPWTPLDSVSWSVVMAWDLAGNWRAELDRVELIKEMGEARVSILLPPYPDDRPIIVPTEVTTTTHDSRPGALATIDWQNVDTNVIGSAPETGFALGTAPFAGSNNWVVAGEHTETGMPLLANDPHLGVQMPSIWYEMGLHAPGWNVSGFSFAATPFIIIGHNEHIAWGVTNAGPDVQDLFIEKINPSNPHQYEFQGDWRDMRVVEEVIKVNGGDDVILPVRITHHGPIINEVREGLRDVLAFNWVAHTPSRLFKAVLLLNQAQNYEEFREALQYWDTAPQNTVYADVEGNIAYQLPGRIPIRKNGDGLLPVPGWTGDYEWVDWVPYDELPALLNPESGYIVTANNAITDDDYPYLLAKQWADGNRAQRIIDLIEMTLVQNERLTADDFARIQFDSYSMLAADYVPLLRGLSSNDIRVQAALERMRGWDLQLRRDSVPAALFEIFYMHLARATLADELGDAASVYLNNGDTQRIFFHALARQPQATWWNNPNTDRVESREDILLQAVAETVQWFDENVGGDMNSWTWGRLHTVTFVSAPLGQSGIGLIESRVNRGPFPVDGGSGVVNANSWSWSDPAAVRGGHASMRMIVDLSDFDASLGIHPTGQSGHAFHKHYDDFIEMWLNGEYHPMLFSREAVEAAAVDRLVLRP